MVFIHLPSSVSSVMKDRIGMFCLGHPLRTTKKIDGKIWTLSVCDAGKKSKSYKVIYNRKDESGLIHSFSVMSTPAVNGVAIFNKSVSNTELSEFGHKVLKMNISQQKSRVCLSSGNNEYCEYTSLKK